MWRIGFWPERQRADARPARLCGMKTSMRMTRRGLCLALVPGLWPGLAEAADPSGEQAAWSALRAGAIVLFRHANAPGIGDPPGMRLGDCSTQRNLNGSGRVQARGMGGRLRREGVKVGAVWTSRWCRTRETAELMAVGPVRNVSAFNSFFDDRRSERAKTHSARQLLLGWRGPGSVVVVTHQVNITALTGVTPESGEGVVLRPQGNELVLVGRVMP
jgi:phosphohistidine phosphatase SixA